MPKPSRRSGFSEAPHAAFEAEQPVSADQELLRALGRGAGAAEDARRKRADAATAEAASEGPAADVARGALRNKASSSGLTGGSM